MTEKKKKLLTMYSDFKKIPFPNNSQDNEEIQDIFSDLVLFDSDTAGLIEKLLNNNAVNKSDLVYDEILEQRIANISDADPALKTSYLIYLKHIKDLILEARHLLE